MRALLGLTLGLAWALAASAQAQDRPNEQDLFGAPSEPSAADAGAGVSEGPTAAAGTKSTGERARDEEALSSGPLKSQFDTDEAKSDPLKIGGQVYMRATASYAERDRFRDVGFTTPELVDGFLDARPSERVRAYLLTRVQYDPTYDPNATSPLALPGAVAPARANPSIALDQLWLRFDVLQTVFVTAGKQHVKWGAARFWNPTDFLTPERKDPLAVFDARLGANMVKVHLPWESKGWNLYAVGLLDNSGPANTLGKVGGAARAEVVLGKTEVGADAVLVSGRRPRYGFDISSGLGPFDVYGELALRSGADFTLWRVRSGATLDTEHPLSDVFERYSPTGTQAIAAGGARTTINYTDKNALTLGVEYFYNPVGYSNPALYPWVMANGQYVPFYTGQHYAGLYALAAGLPDLPFATLVFSTLGNVSDLSFVSRLDFIVLVMSYLQVEAYGAVHYGTKGGELRFGLDLPPVEIAPGTSTPPIFVPAPIFDLGLGLRVSL